MKCSTYEIEGLSATDARKAPTSRVAIRIQSRRDHIARRQEIESVKMEPTSLRPRLPNSRKPQ